MKINRKQTREVQIGSKMIGNQHPVLIQSMTNTDTRDVQATIAQIKALEAAGCDIVRVAVLDLEAAKAIKAIKEGITIPIVADIHFDYQLALQAIESGVDKLRINPGNIGDLDKVKAVAEAAKAKKIPIRIGVNGGSLDPVLLEKYGHPTAEAMVESAKMHIQYLEAVGFYDIVVSMKSSDVQLTIDACTLFAETYDYPLHLGVTEAGVLESATVKSSIGLGYLLLNGIGDTIRVSITGDPVEEVRVGREILAAIGLLHSEKQHPTLISCPTCGRTQIDLIGIAQEVNERLKNVHKEVTVAVMGCIVNGPGEGREADIGIAGGKGRGVLFKKGKIFKTVKEAEIVDALMAEIEKL